MANPSRFWDVIAKRYAKSPVGNAAAYQKKLDITRSYLKPDMDVLEFGCGTGTTAIHHAPRVNHIQAVDFSRKMVAIAQAKADAAGLTNITFQRAGIDDFNPGAGQYDAIMGHSILHLLKNWRQVIGRVQTMLKPGGVFVSSTTCVGGQGGIMRYLLPAGNAIGLLPPVQFFTVSDLVDAMTGAGFAIDHQWRPEGSDAVFIVAKKPGAVTDGIG
jgi:2-polyprenyl-3-methyl-5-hydroxy-6-metoxy-1,4-benzoquinol methylase